eukprot:2807947-Pleurochrysis_carterae.AAC.1
MEPLARFAACLRSNRHRVQSRLALSDAPTPNGATTTRAASDTLTTAQCCEDRITFEVGVAARAHGMTTRKSQSSRWTRAMSIIHSENSKKPETEVPCRASTARTARRSGHARPHHTSKRWRSRRSRRRRR